MKCIIYDGRPLEVLPESGPTISGEFLLQCYVKFDGSSSFFLLLLRLLITVLY